MFISTIRQCPVWNRVEPPAIDLRKPTSSACRRRISSGPSSAQSLSIPWTSRCKEPHSVASIVPVAPHGPSGPALALCPPHPTPPHQGPCLPRTARLDFASQQPRQPPTPQRTPHRHARGLVPASLRPWGSKLRGQEQDWTQQRVSPDTSGQASFFHALHDPRPDSGVVTMPPARSIPKPAHAATQHRHVAATAGKTRKSSPPCLPQPYISEPTRSGRRHHAPEARGN